MTKQGCVKSLVKVFIIGQQLLFIVGFLFFFTIRPRDGDVWPQKIYIYKQVK